MIMLETGKVIPVVNPPSIDRVIEALRWRDFERHRKNQRVIKFPTILPSPDKEDRANLIVEIDSVGHGPTRDGSTWVVIATLARRSDNDFWSKSGDSSCNPRVRISYSGAVPDVMFELHLDS